MWERLLPKTVDNGYRGQPLALWVFVPIMVVTLGRSLVLLLSLRDRTRNSERVPEGAATATQART